MTCGGIGRNERSPYGMLWAGRCQNMITPQRLAVSLQSVDELPDANGGISLKLNRILGLLSLRGHLKIPAW
jgi:hypothetical protein